MEKALTRVHRKSEIKETWRQRYHFTPPDSWMNDPNGLIYYKEWYHLFYQYNPKGCDWDSMHWGHAVSKDMIHWQDMPIALKPDQKYDCHPEGGCFSGSAIEKDGILYIFYTATTKVNGITSQTQCIVTSKDGCTFEKYAGNPVIKEPPQGMSADFRDPKVFEHKGKWYMVVGGCVGDATKDGDGRIFLYESENLYDWKYKGNILESDGKMGTMIECPDMFELDGKWVVTCSPMNHPDYNKALYCVGTMDFENCVYKIEKTGNMDVGFDYYAPQSFLDKHGNRVLIAWQNGWLWMPWCEDWGPTSRENWRGSLSIPRKVCLDDKMNLCMYPADEIDSLVSETISYRELEVHAGRRKLFADENRSFRMNMQIDINRVESRSIELYVLGRDDRYTMIQIDFIGKLISVDKSCSDNFGNGRMNSSFELHDNKLELCIMVDHSSVEVYINHGESCITTNVYPEGDQTECWLQTPYKKAIINHIQVDFLDSFWTS